LGNINPKLFDTKTYTISVFYEDVGYASLALNAFG
jgi:hypothetical protein